MVKINKTFLVFIGALITSIISSSSGFAAEPNITHGNGALEIFDGEGFANSPQWVRIWVYIMLGTFAAGLLFVWKRVEPRWLLGGLVLGLVATKFVPEIIGFPVLSGFIALIHLIFWTPGLIVLLKRHAFLKERSLFGLWTGLATGVVLFSFVFDIRDAAIYLDYIIGVGILS